MAINLEEVAYIIGGILKTECKAGNQFQVELVDPTGDICFVNGREVRGHGKTEEEAKKNLAEMMRGKELAYDIPIMWKTATESLRIPPTLTA